MNSQNTRGSTFKDHLLIRKNPYLLRLTSNGMLMISINLRSTETSHVDSPHQMERELFIQKQEWRFIHQVLKRKKKCQLISDVIIQPGKDKKMLNSIFQSTDKISLEISHSLSMIVLIFTESLPWQDLTLATLELN